MIDPIHASYQHRGKVIQILIVGDVNDCWEAYVAGGLKRIPKERVLVNRSYVGDRAIGRSAAER